MTEDSRIRQVHPATRVVSRRRLLQVAGTAAVGVPLAACAPAAPSPTAVATPASSSTTPPKPAATAAPAAAPKPTAGAPTAAAQQKAPPVFTPATARVVTTSGATQGVIRTLVEKLGYYREFGLQVQRDEIADGNKILAAVVAGEADLGDAGIGQVFPAVLQGGDVKLIGAHYTLAGYIIYASPEVKSLKDLEGKSVGAGPPGALLNILASASLKKAGVDISKVNFVNIGGSPAVFQAVAVRKVDAGVSGSTFAKAAKDQGVQALADVWTLLPDYVSTGFFANQRTISRRRDVLVRLLAAYGKTFRYLKTPESKTAWVDTGVKDYKLTPEDATADWEWTREHGALAYDLALTAKQIEFMQQVNIDVGLQQQMLPLDRVFDPTIARDALGLLSG